MANGRNPFTQREDELLVKYIAKNNPELPGRTGNKLYINLTDNEGNRWPWSKNHPWQSWRERYRKDQNRFDRKIKEYQKNDDRKKRRAIIDSREEEEQSEKDEPTVTQPIASSSKANLPSPSKPHTNRSSNNATEREKVVAPDRQKDKTGVAKVVQSKPNPKTTAENVERQVERGGPGEEEAESLSEEMMHDLFGSFVEDDEENELNERSPEQNERSPSKVYPNTADLPAPTMDTMEPRVPGAFDQPPPIAQQQIKPKPVLVNSRPPIKKRKRKEEEDPFRSSSGSPPPAVASKTPAPKQPPTVIEGPFRTTLKPASDRRTSNENDEFDWVPKRQKRGRNYDTIPPQPLHQQNAVIPTRRSPQVNAVASSSRVQLSPSHAIHPRGLGDISPPSLPPTKAITPSSNPRPQTEPFLKRLDDDVLLRPSIGKKTAEKRPGGNIPTNHQNQAPQTSLVIKKPSENANAFRTEAPRPLNNKTIVDINHEPPSKALSRSGSGSQILPSRPTTDNDPFTTSTKTTHISDKAAGKARASEPQEVAEMVLNRPRRIDFYQENLSRRLRPKASLSSRRSSVVSSRTSTGSSTTTPAAAAAKNLKPTDGNSNGPSTARRSSAHRSLTSALEVIPDDKKQTYALAAAEAIASTMEQMAKEYDVSLDFAMRQFMKTRNIESTRRVLSQIRQNMLNMEREIFAQNPDLNHLSDGGEKDGDDDGDSDVPEGLVLRNTPETKREVRGPRHSGATSLTHTRRSRGNRPQPSLNIRPTIERDDPLSDYSPPRGSRAGQFARLVKQNRKQEAIEREKRRVSGLMYPFTQTQVNVSGSGSTKKHALLSNAERGVTVTPTPHSQRAGNVLALKPLHVDVNKPAEADDDDDDDMYVDKEPEPEQQDQMHVQDTDDERASRSQNANDESRGPSPSPSTLSLAASTTHHDPDHDEDEVSMDELILEMYNKNPDLALEHQALALSVDADNVDSMQEFEAGQDPDFLRLMSIRLVEQILGATAQEEGEGEGDKEEHAEGDDY